MEDFYMQAVNEIIDELMGNDSLKASPYVWHKLCEIKELSAAAPEAHVIKLRMDIDKNELLKAFEAAKKNLTTVLPRETTGWIPVAEKEPEENQKAICTNKHSEMMIGTYTKYGWMFPCYFETPIAWMPLPDPYKEGEK